MVALEPRAALLVLSWVSLEPCAHVASKHAAVWLESRWGKRSIRMKRKNSLQSGHRRTVWGMAPERAFAVWLLVVLLLDQQQPFEEHENSVVFAYTVQR